MSLQRPHSQMHAQDRARYFLTGRNLPLEGTIFLTGTEYFQLALQGIHQVT